MIAVSQWFLFQRIAWGYWGWDLKPICFLEERHHAFNKTSREFFSFSLLVSMARNIAFTFTKEEPRGRNSYFEEYPTEFPYSAIRLERWSWRSNACSQCCYHDGEIQDWTSAVENRRLYKFQPFDLPIPSVFSPTPKEKRLHSDGRFYLLRSTSVGRYWRCSLRRRA